MTDSSEPTATSCPNILFICTDQQRYDSLGCYGNQWIKTPAIDRLAQEGVLFENCYTQSPVCAPARASLLTGQYPSNHGLWANGVSLPAHHRLFTRELADNGYDCGMVGKFHLGACFGGRTEPRLDDGLRFFRWAHDPTHGSPENAYHRWLAERFPDLHREATAQGFGRQGHNAVPFDTMPTEAHYSRWVGDTTIDFLKSARDPRRPFFFWANFFDPHHPFVAPHEYLTLYDPAALPPPIGGLDELTSKPPIFAEASQASYAGHARGFASYSSKEIQEVIAAYYAMISLIDDEVGRILATLDAIGERDNTLVVFTSDHGEMLGDHALLLKGPMMYEGAVHVPLIARWPGQVPSGLRRSEIVEWIDLCPTLLDVAGLPPMASCQGSSLLPLARGKNPEWRDWALCEYRNSGHPYDPPVHTTMLRRGSFKLIVHHSGPASRRGRTGELYDLEADPQELRNLWSDPGYLPVRVNLEEFLLDALVATEDRSQRREAYW